MSRTLVHLYFVAVFFTQTWTYIDFEKIVWLGKRFCVQISFSYTCKLALRVYHKLSRYYRWYGTPVISMWIKVQFNKYTFTFTIFDQKDMF